MRSGEGPRKDTWVAVDDGEVEVVIEVEMDGGLRVEVDAGKEWEAWEAVGRIEAAEERSVRVDIL